MKNHLNHKLFHRNFNNLTMKRVHHQLMIRRAGIQVREELRL